jgi:hypothetical protein
MRKFENPGVTIMTESPYAPPASDVYMEPEFKRSVLWKIYFYISVVLSIFGYAVIFFTPGAGVIEVVSLVVSLASTLGIFGFIFCKKIFSPSVWLAVLLLSFGYSVAYYFLTHIDLSAGLDPMGNLISQAIGWGFAIPGYIALYLYSKPTNPIWCDSQE